MTRSRFPEDPFSKREAEKYAEPIPSREYILDCLIKSPEPLTFTQLCKMLKLKDASHEPLQRRLRAMERDGQIHRNRRGNFGVVSKMQLVRGRVQGHRDGYGFVIPDEGGKDLFLSQTQMAKVFHGDRVLANVIQEKNGRLSGSIVEILERQVKQVVGRYAFENGVGFVIPEDRHLRHDIMIPAKNRHGCKEGDVVIVTITHYPERHQPAIGKVIEVLGEHLAPGVEIDVAIRSHQLPFEWSRAAQAQAKKLPKSVDEKSLRGRQDLRDLFFVTIDGADAKDFDDAVYCEPLPKGGWRLLVAIADVSHYVKSGSALDEAAYERSTSVYFPQRVIPMLPEELSNELCSLKANVDRLCLTCEASIDEQGHVKRFRFYPAVIHSKMRLTYTTVAELLDNPSEALQKDHKDFLPHLKNLHDLYQQLWSQREARYALEFITTETKVLFDEHKKISAVIPAERNVAHRIIEECMLVANVCAAKFAEQHKMPILYRVHEKPPLEKLTDVKNFLASLKLQLGGAKEPTVQDFSELLEKVQDHPDATLIHQVLLRSMSRAQYSPNNIGHFGLAYPAYTHFTSPIRRYPDLITHRAIYWQLAKEQGDSKQPDFYSLPEMQRFGDHCTACEQRADEATRDVMLWLKCEYMLDKLGESFPGIISGVTSFGLFVTLDKIWVDGLIHVASLPNDYYTYDPSLQSLIGERTGKRYRLGDKLTVTVARVDLDDRKVDLTLT